MEGYKVVTAAEMARIERLSIEEGASAEEYMEHAAQGLAKRVKEFIQKEGLEKKCIFLIGKGNNGGDGLGCARFLLEEGFSLSVYHLFSKLKSSPLCQKMQEKFEKKGGEVTEIESAHEISPIARGVVVDALLGTGFQGKVEGLIAQVIQHVNRLSMPILSIDIPSGVSGDSGVVETVAIKAKETFFLQMPKKGFFLEDGYNHVGKLASVSFGLDPKYLREVASVGCLVNEKELPQLLPPLVRNRHKYQAGYLLSLAGSSGMGGAALLSSLSALRAGAGIVRLFYPEEMKGELSSRPYEVITSSYREKDLTLLIEESKRGHALLIGPGLGKEAKKEEVVKEAIQKTTLPLVVDADAIFHLKGNFSLMKRPLILTPHHGEMCRLLGTQKIGLEKLLHESQVFAEKNNLTLVLKGAPTWIFHKNSSPLVIPRGDPGIATAGAGDVLSGILGAFLAQKMETRKAAVLGVTLHGIAGEIAAKEKSSYGMIASDLIECLPKAFLQLLTSNPH